MSIYRCHFCKTDIGMTLSNGLIFLSSVSFFFYGMSYFFSPNMKSEFKRFHLEKFGLLTATLEVCGSLGLVVGVWIPPFLVLSSAGLACLMFFALVFRIKHRDPFLSCLPALFFLLLNTYLLRLSISI